MSVPTGDAVALTSALVRCDSRNPSLAPGATGEGAIAVVLRDVLASWGMDARVIEVAPERPNVVAIIHGTGGGRSMMFNGHIDTVGVEGMVHPPFDASIRDGRLYGRGSSDMKGGVAAMCAAAARVRGGAGGQLKGDLVIAAVMDEEWTSLGTRALLDSGLRADAAIVTEPTGLRIMPAHKGFVWLEIVVAGRASHGSRWDIGVDAIRGAGLFLAELDRLDREALPRRTHQLLGRPSVHASVIEGGLGLSTYPDRCVIKVERRTLPGERAQDVLVEFQSLCARVRATRPEFGFETTVSFAQPPSDVPLDAPVVEALSTSVREAGHAMSIAGMSAWTDAALLNERGIPAICFGPGDMGLAHAAEEYIAVNEIEHATAILASLARRWCN
ncbi:MAG: ArgE/DapE family deacylase [Gemmatimonadaceae bacterium]